MWFLTQTYLPYPKLQKLSLRSATGGCLIQSIDNTKTESNSPTKQNHTTTDLMCKTTIPSPLEDIEIILTDKLQRSHVMLTQLYHVSCASQTPVNSSFRCISLYVLWHKVASAHLKHPSESFVSQIKHAEQCDDNIAGCVIIDFTLISMQSRYYISTSVLLWCSLKLPKIP